MIVGRSELLKMITGKPPLIEDFVELELQLQPAGFDLTLREVRAFRDSGYIDLSNERRRISETMLLPFDDRGRVHLPKGAYLVVFNEKLNLPLDVAAIARPRSSLIRSGATVETAVWDPGYRGRSKALLLVFNESGITLERNARLVQLVFLRVTGDVVKGYDGAFQGEL